ncbi:MAG: histidine kinase dimerization/phosphoacceptor domain -containing protein, partial [Marinoscillum sp.]
LALGQLEASAKTLNNIGIIHFDQKDYKKAMRYYQQALDLEIENPAGSARTLGNMGLNFLEQDLYQDALDYYRKSFHIVDSIGAPCRALYAINGVGQAFSKLQQLDSAKHYLTEALNQARTCQDPVIQTSALLELGNIAFTESRLNDAKKYLLESEKIARSNKLMAHFKEASDALYQYYKETNDTKNALHYLETSFALRDSLFNEDLTKKLTTLELSYNFQKERDSLDYIQKAEILTYDARIKRQNLLQLITIGGLTVVMIVAFVIYRYYRLKNLANKELTVKNQQISEALEEREVLLQEVHHRVKNNLQVVSSLLNIQSKFLEDESAKKAILEGRDRVLSMALVHQRLYEHKNLSQIDIKEYLTQLSDTLFDSYRIGQDQVRLNKDIDNLDIDLDTSIHLGLIVNELISNALKHAFQEGGQGQIELSLKEVGNEYQLSVSDNGSGVASEEQLLKSHGFRIVKSLVRGLNANLIVNIASGTFIMISFIKPIPVTQTNRD